MTFEPIITTTCTRDSMVTMSLTRQGTIEPRVTVSLDKSVVAQLGLGRGDYCLVLIGRGSDAGVVRLVPTSFGGNGSPIKIQGKKGGSRVFIQVKPWFDSRGERRSSTPCEYHADTTKRFIEVSIPDNFTDVVSRPRLKEAV